MSDPIVESDEASVRFRPYGNPKAVGWLGWITSFGRPVGYVRLERR
jgi:hypothetical protein